jgi:hypothetical protein
MDGVNALSVTGLVSDLVGAAALGYGIVSTPYGVLASLTQPWAFGRNPLHVSSVCEQQYDTLCGLWFLFVGFALQITASFWSVQTPVAWFLLLGLLAVGAILMLLLRRRIVDRIAARVQELGAQARRRASCINGSRAREREHRHFA